MLRDDEHVDLFSPITFARYFDCVYASRDLDRHQVQPLREQFRFAQTAANFRMIDESAESVLENWNDAARRLIAELRHSGPSRALLRLLQPYTVGVFPQERRALERVAAVESVSGYLVLGDFKPNAFYTDDVGLVTLADPSVDLVM
jgi:CRISPR-associated endonuclease/helicase Cas3